MKPGAGWTEILRVERRHSDPSRASPGARPAAKRANAGCSATFNGATVRAVVFVTVGVLAIMVGLGVIRIG